MTERPSWIPEEEQCFYCFKSSSLSIVSPSEDSSGVETWYVCSNKDCDNGKFGFFYKGKFYVDSLEKQDEES
jgi:hypothetical protein